MTQKKIDYDVVCLMPWTHMHIWPNGNTLPCCMADSREVFGNIRDGKISEIINNANFKNIRKQMINGEKPRVCSRCYELEETADSWTLRKNSLESMKGYKYLLEETEDDGTISDFKMRYMDIRFSNLCNMKCRTCGPDLSSKWYDDQMKLYPDESRKKFIDVADVPHFMDDLKTHLPYVDEVYFAGGEVLITPQHYEVLDYWLEHGYDRVKLRYTTNFGTLGYKDKDILKYWKTFKDVRVAASLDTYGEKAEYSRKGTDWNEIVDNRRKMISECPDVYFEITPTVSIFSVYSLFDMHKTWVDEKLLDIDNVRINILTHPRYFSITVLPEAFKKEIAEKYTMYIDWLVKSNARQNTINAVKGIVDYMFSADHSHLLPEMKYNLNMIDNIRDEKFVEIYKEFKGL